MSYSRTPTVALLGHRGSGKSTLFEAAKGESSVDFEERRDVFHTTAIHFTKKEPNSDSSPASKAIIYTRTLSIWDIPGRIASDETHRTLFESYIVDKAPVFVVNLRESLADGSPQRQTLRALNQLTRETQKARGDTTYPCFIIATISDPKNHIATEDELTSLVDEFKAEQFWSGGHFATFSNAETDPCSNAHDIFNAISKAYALYIDRQKELESHQAADQKENAVVADSPAQVVLNQPAKSSNTFWRNAFIAVLAVSILITLSVLTYGAFTFGMAAIFASAAGSASTAGSFVTAGVLDVFGGSMLMGLGVMFCAYIGAKCCRKKPTPQSVVQVSAPAQAASAERRNSNSTSSTYSSTFESLIVEAENTSGQDSSASAASNRVFRSPFQARNVRDSQKMELQPLLRKSARSMS